MWSPLWSGKQRCHLMRLNLHKFCLEAMNLAYRGRCYSNVQVFSTPRGQSPISVTVVHYVMEELNKGNLPPQVLRMLAILMEIVCRQHLHSSTQNQKFHDHMNSIEQPSLPLTQSWKGRYGVECRMSLAWDHKRDGWVLSLGSCGACPKCVCWAN